MTRWLSTVLPHEWAFNGFLLLTLARLLADGEYASAPTAFFLVLPLVGAALVAWTQANPTPTRWRIRLLWYPSVMGVSFYVIPDAVAALGLPLADAQLRGIDEQLLGHAAARVFEPLLSPALTDLMCAAYSFFFVYLIVGPGYYCLRDLPRFRICISGMFTTYALGFIGYTLLPARGPYHAINFADALPLGPLSSLVLPFINTSSNGVDVFPSIHAAISLYLLLLDRRHYPQRFRWLLLPCALLWLSTVYLRYHYFIDLMAGAVIAAIGLAVARWQEGRAPATPLLQPEHELEVRLADRNHRQPRATHQELEASQ